MTFVRGCLAIAIGNLVLLVGLGRWNAELHPAVGGLAMLLLVVSWVLLWDEDVPAATVGAERE